MRVIDLEAHFYTENYIKYLRSRKDAPREELMSDGRVRLHMGDNLWAPRSVKLEKQLCDLGEERIKEMDAAGVAMQALSLAVPGCEQFDTADGLAQARETNDELAEWVKKYPDRYIGLAALAPQDPLEAAKELRRCVNELGFRGAKLNSHCQNEYLDDPKFWPVFEAASELDVPIYLHPTVPSTKILDGYKDYGFPMAGPPLGFGQDTLLHTMRLVYSGLFDKYPNLQIVLGHMGEGIPFWFYRLDFYWLKPWVAKELMPKAQKKPSHYFLNNFYFTCSGMQYLPAILCAYMAVGGDRITFGADHPFESSKETLELIGTLPFSDPDKEKFYHGNAERLFKINSK